MTAFIIRRLLQSALVLFATSLLVFVAVYAIGNPLDVLLPGDATQAERAAAAAQLGLDKPLVVQYLTFVWNALHGDFGRSFVFDQPSISLILNRLPATMELAIVALALSLGIGVPLGFAAGLRPGSLADETIMTGSILGFSLPTFWQGLMLIMIFSVWLGWLPSSGRGDVGTILGIHTSLVTVSGLQHLLLPAINLALSQIALVTRLTRTGVQETMPLDFIKFARAKGLTEPHIVLVHVLRMILIPIVTVVGLEFGTIVAFAVVTETIFAWPGMGKLIIDSITSLDRPVIVAYILVVVTMFILINLLVDVLYTLLDPRIRLKGSA